MQRFSFSNILFSPGLPDLRSLSFLHLILESVLWYALLLSICPTAMFGAGHLKSRFAADDFCEYFLRPGVGVAKRGDFPLRESNQGRRLGPGCDQLCEPYRSVSVHFTKTCNWSIFPENKQTNKHYLHILHDMFLTYSSHGKL